MTVIISLPKNFRARNFRIIRKYFNNENFPNLRYFSSNASTKDFSRGEKIYDRQRNCIIYVEFLVGHPNKL